MAKANDKKVVKEARSLLLSTLGNLLESHRERNFTYSQSPQPLPRRLFCKRNSLKESTVAHIETGRFLGLDVGQLNLYLAATYKRNDPTFKTSVKKVYDGLKELTELLKEL
jgi:hypothetical protein